MNTEQGILNNEVLTICNNTGYLIFLIFFRCFYAFYKYVN